MNKYNNNVLLMILLLVTSLTSFFIFIKSVKSSIYPLIIFIVSLFLLFHNSLISTQIIGYDINNEYYFASLVIKNAYWNFNIYADANSMLSVVMLAPIYSILCKIELTWVFKIIYPLIFSIVPLGIYSLAEKFTTKKIAFLAAFYFISVYIFYCDMISLARQEIAELFFILLLLITVTYNMDKIKKSLLFLIFGTSLIVSHYALSYFYMFYVLLTVLIIYLIHKNLSRINKIFSNFKIKIENFNLSDIALTLNFAILFVVLGLAWSMYTSESSTFSSLVKIFDKMLSTVSTEILNPRYVQGVTIVTSTEPSSLKQLTKILYYMSQLFIGLGFIYVLIQKSKFKIEYKILSLLSFLILFCALTVPFFAFSLQTSRIYHISLLLLSPFFVFGVIATFKMINFATHLKINNEIILKFTAIFLTIFFLFNSGFIYEIGGDLQPSMSIIALDNSFDYPIFNNQEVYGAIWVSNYNTNNKIYSDNYRNLILHSYSPVGNLKIIIDDQYIQNSSLIYYGTFNIKHNLIIITSFAKYSYGESIQVKIDDNSLNKIYDNNGSEICLTNYGFRY